MYQEQPDSERTSEAKPLDAESGIWPCLATTKELCSGESLRLLSQLTGSLHDAHQNAKTHRAPSILGKPAQIKKPTTDASMMLHEHNIESLSAVGLQVQSRKISVSAASN